MRPFNGQDKIFLSHSCDQTLPSCHSTGGWPEVHPPGWCLSILPSILQAYPTPSHIIHPHTITEPPPNFIVPSTNLSPTLFSPCFFHTHFFPSDPNLLILVSSDQTTLFQSSTVQSLCATAKSILSFLCLLLSKGIFFLVTAFRPTVFRHLLMVCAEIGWLVILLRVLAICTAFSALPELIKHERYGQIGFY